MPTSLKVAVIGAGLCGLIAARELERESHEVVVLEKSHRLGGVWVYDPRTESDLLGIDPDREIIHATIYKSLRTNSPRQIMGFSDYMFEGKEYGDPRMFPGHEEFLRYLEDFAEKFGVTKLIRFNSEVTRVELLDSGNEFVVEWKMNGSSSTSGSTLTEVFDAVVVCNGHNSQPRVAMDIPGIREWPNKQLHAHNYRVPEPFHDQVVVIIGNESSAYDISRELAAVAKEVHLSSRSPNVKVSKLEKYDNIWQHSKGKNNVALHHLCIYFGGGKRTGWVMGLAAKSEESTVQARLLVFYIKKIYPDERYRCEIKEILEMEMKILEALNYYLVVFHPYRSLPQLLQDAGMSDAIQLTWGIVTDTYRMDLILIHPPYLIGLACIYVASVLNEKDNTAWFEDLRVDMNVVKNVAMEILDFYDKQRTISDERMNAAMLKLGVRK